MGYEDARQSATGGRCLNDQRGALFWSWSWSRTSAPPRRLSWRGVRGTRCSPYWQWSRSSLA